MSERIKGITVVIGGDSVGLDKAMKEINTQANKLQGELKQVEKLLKLDPKNTELLAQKQKILSEAVGTTKDKLEQLKLAQQQVNEQFAKGEINESQYRALQREIAATEQALKKLETNGKKSLKELGKSAKDLGGKISGVGEKATLGLTAPIVAGAAVAFNAASDQAESMNKVEVAFKGAANEVKAFSDTTLESYGIAKGTSLDMASLFGDMGTAMGQTPKEASKMSKSLVGLAGDLASFKNIGVDQAQDALKGIFTGEGESLKTLGVIMQDSTLQAYALAQGQKTAYKDMSQAEKVALRYAFVMDATKNAQGDFARTSQGAANQTRILQESAKEAAASLGTELLPVITPIIKGLADLIKKFTELSPSTKRIILIIAGIVAAIGPLLMIVGSVISGIGSLMLVAGGLGISIGALAAPVLIVIGIIAALITIGVLLFKNWDKIKEKAHEIATAITGFFKNIKLPEIKIPKIKLPHFKIKGEFSLKPPSVPYLGVDWYAKGGIFTGPSIIGVGEAGTEAVLPIDRLNGIMAKAIQTVGGLKTTKTEVKHKGTIRVEGINDKGQLAGVVDIIVDRLQMEARMG